MPPEEKQPEKSDVFLIVEFRPFNKKTEYSQAITEDASPEGLSFDSSSHYLKSGDILELKLRRSHSDAYVSVIGEIVWTKEAWYKCVTKVKFKDIDKETESRIADLISGVKDALPGQASTDRETQAVETVREEKETEAGPDISREENLPVEELEDVKAGLEEAGTGVTSSKKDSSGPASVISGTVDDVITRIKSAGTGSEKTGDLQGRGMSPREPEEEDTRQVDGIRKADDKAPAREKARGGRNRVYMQLAVVFAVVSAVVIVFLSSDMFKNTEIGPLTHTSEPISIQEQDIGINQPVKSEDHALPDNSTGQESAEPVESYEASGINNDLPEGDKTDVSEQTLPVSAPVIETAGEKPPGIIDNTLPDRSSIKENNIHIPDIVRTITFDRNSDVVSPMFYREIDKTADTLHKYSEVIAKVAGHTDSTGDEAYNVDLSVRRARAVKNLLVNKGVDDSRVEITGFGSAGPVDTNDNESGRKRNRRVEIKIIQSGR